MKKWGGTKSDPTGLLLRCLASLVFHSEWIQKFALNDIKHPFNHIVIFAFPDLVIELKNLITTNISPIIRKPTGVPPHVKQAIKMEKILVAVSDTLQLVKNQYGDFKVLMHEVLDERDEQNGMVSGSKILELLKSFKTDIIEDVMKEIKQCVGEKQIIEPASPSAANSPRFSPGFDCQVDMD